MKTLNGSCLCGLISYQVSDTFSLFHLCHCTQCQKTTGSAHASNLFIDADKFSWITGEGSLQRYDVPGRAISQAFCTTCGCGMPYLSKSGSGKMVIPAGSLDDQVEITPSRHIFWEERANWYDGAANAEKTDSFPA